MFGGVAADVPEALADHLRRVELIDHHVHGAFEKAVDRADFEAAINEGSTDPVAVVHDAVRFAAGPFDPPLVRTATGARTAWRTPTTYWRRRSELAPDELAALMLRAAGVSRWIVDTGYQG